MDRTRRRETSGCKTLDAAAFLPIGSLALPTESRKLVGCITIKGPAERIADYPRLLAEALGAPSPS